MLGKMGEDLSQEQCKLKDDDTLKAMRVILEGEYTEIHELCLRHKVGDQGSISFDHLHNYLMNNKKDDNDFKVSFVLYIMGIILCLTSEFGVNKRFLHALKDLSSVRELDWSQFVLKFLAECIQKYQKGRKVIRGCLLFLMVKVIIEDGVGKRERMMNLRREVDHDKSMENDQVKNLTGMVERMSSLLEETLAAMHEKDCKRKYSATNGGINKKDTPSALEEPDVEGHFKTKKAKCTKNALSDQMISPLKTNKKKGKEEAKLNASLKRLRKMTANVREALSRTAPAIDGKNKWEKKLKTNRFDKSQPPKRNANKNYALRGGLNAKSWDRHYTGTHRYTGEPQACERVYIPINDSDNHWFMCVVNIRHGIVYILDSLPSPTENKRRAELVKCVVKYLDDLFQYLDEPQVKKFSMLPFERLKWLPIQEVGDCGVHTAKYFNLEQFIEDELIMLKFSSAEGRIGLVLDLIIFEGNNVKEKIMEKAKKKYPSPKGKN
ncbi:hypothetical protein RHMOL_Rhmol05G0213500 [Rhododendron molle]|uniref:Uncharacterized protein n=1 Tax=Rhododendron molle TaxID=49168 RepID=A0ACC0NSM0_RHOML|nr:hypothetical protein RHMOL_Rhmol05G0213500 [Rhododendron molle]